MKLPHNVTSSLESEPTCIERCDKIFSTAQDGKLYDAYVSYLHADASSAETSSFVLHILPEELEKQHGYSLYIRGRDDCPGEGQECYTDSLITMVNIFRTS